MMCLGHLIHGSQLLVGRLSNKNEVNMVATKRDRKVNKCFSESARERMKIKTDRRDVKINTQSE